MSVQADSELNDLEQQMLRIVKAQLDDFEQSQDDTVKPLPISLVTAYDKVHRSILTHVAKGSGMDMNQVMKNPRAWLYQNDRMRNQVLKLIEQQEKGNLRVLPAAEAK